MNNNKQLIEIFFQTIFTKFQNNSEKSSCPILGSYVIENSSDSTTDIIEILKNINDARENILHFPFRSHKIFAPNKLIMFEIVFQNPLNFTCNINNLNYKFIIENCKYYYFGDNNQYIFLKFEGAQTMSLQHILQTLGTYGPIKKSRIEKLDPRSVAKTSKISSKSAERLYDDTLLFYHAENHHISHYSIKEDDLSVGRGKKKFKKIEVDDMNNHDIIANIFDLSLSEYIKKKEEYYKYANLEHITDKLFDWSNKQNSTSRISRARKLTSSILPKKSPSICETQCNPKNDNLGAIDCKYCLTNDIFIPFEYIRRNLYLSDTSRGGKKILKKHKTTKHKTTKHKTTKHKTRKNKKRKYNITKN